MSDDSGRPADSSLPLPQAGHGPASVIELERYHFTHHLSPATRDRLKEIFASWQESEKAEALVRDILAQEPDTLGVRIVAYRFYFYRRRPREAARWALACMEWIADRLGLPRDWRQVTPEMADFSHWHAFTHLWLQSLTAYAYNLARVGDDAESREALAKVAELDSRGKLGAASLGEVLFGPRGDAGMVFPKDEPQPPVIGS